MPEHAAASFGLGCEYDKYAAHPGMDIWSSPKPCLPNLILTMDEDSVDGAAEQARIYSDAGLDAGRLY